MSLNSTFVVKFQQYNNYSITTDGMAFDDIKVEAGGNSSYEWIDSVQLGIINNSIGNDGGYKDYTDQSSDLIF